MRKIVILLIILIMVSVGFLSGCQKSDKELFVGTWVAKDENITDSFRLYSNGKCQGQPFVSISFAESWEIVDERLLFYSKSGSIIASHKYMIWDTGCILYSGGYMCAYEKK